MTGQEIATRADHPAPTILTNEQLKFIAGTEFVPSGLRNNIPAILACVATGRALGLDDMTALRSIHVIEGKATFSAELMVQLVRRAGHSIVGEVGEGVASVTGTRIDNGDAMTSTWTMAMAERAGLAGKSNWKKYPESMLWARAVSQLCRMLFADCFAGATYTTEELGAEATDSFGVPVDTDDDRLFPPVDANGEIVAAGGAALGESAGRETDVSSRSVPSPAEAEPLTSPPAVSADSAGSPSADVEIATVAQQGLIRVKASQAGLDDDARHELITAITGQPSSKLVPKAMVNDVLAEIARQAVAA